MIYVDEKYLTIAGKKIPGQVQSVTITEEGKIEDKKNSKGKTVYGAYSDVKSVYVDW